MQKKMHNSGSDPLCAHAMLICLVCGCTFNHVQWMYVGMCSHVLFNRHHICQKALSGSVIDPGPDYGGWRQSSTPL